MSDKKSLPILNPTSQQLVQSVGTSLKTTAKLLANSTMPTESDWAWWNGLSYDWQFVFLENLKENRIRQLSPDCFSYFDSDEKIPIPNNLSISALELKKLLKIKKLYDVTWARLEDITPLLRLTQLTELDLWENQINDISALGNLTQLTELNLALNQINDISALGKLTQLTRLNLWSNQIRDISVLRNLTQLTYLALHSNQISDISALGNLTQLTYLALPSNQISDISALGNLTQLTELWLDYNQISDISVLGNLTQLTKLDLRANFITEAQLNWLKQKLPNTEIYS